MPRLVFVVLTEYSDLSDAVKQIEHHRSKLKSWPPPTSKLHDPSEKGIIGIVEEEMGFLD